MVRKLLIAGFILSVIPYCPARSKRPNQIPNGSKFSCLNCHLGQGGPRNAFGSMIETGHLTVPGINGDVKWDSTLARLEADGDGFTNGVELQDSNGEWTAGNPNPGTSSLVTNPGDSKSKPASAVEEKNTGILPERMELEQNYPNPFNPTTKIRYELPRDLRVTVRVFDARGRLVQTMVDGKQSAGSYTVELDASFLAGGLYFCILQTDEFKAVQKMMLVR
jgi:hypothetical protein